MLHFKPEMIGRKQQKRLEVLFTLPSSILACRHLNWRNKQAENEWVTHVTFSILWPQKQGTATYNPGTSAIWVMGKGDIEEWTDPLSRTRKN